MQPTLVAEPGLKYKLPVPMENDVSTEEIEMNGSNEFWEIVLLTWV